MFIKEPFYCRSDYFPHSSSKFVRQQFARLRQSAHLPALSSPSSSSWLVVVSEWCRPEVPSQTCRSRCRPPTFPPRSLFVPQPGESPPPPSTKPGLWSPQKLRRRFRSEFCPSETRARRRPGLRGGGRELLCWTALAAVRYCQSSLQYLHFKTKYLLS